MAYILNMNSYSNAYINRAGLAGLMSKYMLSAYEVYFTLEWIDHVYVLVQNHSDPNHAKNATPAWNLPIPSIKILR